MNEVLGRLHFWPSLLLMNAIFFPMLLLGLAGVSRRLYDAGIQYAHAQGVFPLNKLSSYAAWALAVAQLPFIFNLFWSLFKGKRVTSDNPWEATTLEWQTATPPGHGNFETVPVVHRGPYEYSVPGASRDFTPQNEPGRTG